MISFRGVDIFFNVLFEYLFFVKMYLVFNRVVLKYDGLYIVLGFIGFSFEDFVLNFIGRYKVVDFIYVFI